MSCDGVVCGTGGFSGPKPGDPDNNAALSAVPAYGGIDLTWTYPLVNPFAVSHINIFRGLTNNPDLAVRRNIASGTYYFDKIPSDEIQEYFYWIQFVSTNGTYLDWIGPVSAVPKASINEILLALSGKINEGVLSQSLQDKFGQVTLLQTALNDEINARLTGSAAMADALSAVQSETAQALTVITQEVTQRRSADESLVNSVNTVAAGMRDNAAAIANESLVRATEMSAVALQISTAETTLNGQIAGVETTMGAAIQDMEQTKDKLNSLYTVKLTADGLAGGFGLVNDGSSVQAGFDVDTFWVGRTQADKLKPFIIDGDTVFLSNAVVPTIQSNNYEPGVSGWKIRKDGPAEFQDVIIRGTGTFGGDLQAAGGTFTGSLSAATGTFAGSLLAGVMDFSSFAGVSYQYKTPGNFSLTVPADKTSMRITVIGGGGGGGGGGANQDDGYTPGGGGGGGGAGNTISGTYTMKAGSTINFTVGSGGTGGGAQAWWGSNPGSAGTSSSLSGTLSNDVPMSCSASGGTGGGGGCANGSQYGSTSLGGAGGSIGGASGQTVNKGFLGTNEYGGGVYSNPNLPPGNGGSGGASAYGAGGAGGGANAAGGNGAAGSGGGGGGGESGPGSVNNVGGNGGSGMIIIEFFNPNAVVLSSQFQGLIASYNQLAGAMGRSDLQYTTA